MIFLGIETIDAIDAIDYVFFEKNEKKRLLATDFAQKKRIYK